MNKNKILLPLFVLLIFFFISCDNKVFYEKIDAIPNEVWNVDSVLYYEFEIDDTLQTFNIFINIRNSVDFETQNFYLFMRTTIPDGTVDQDTLGCILSDAHGKWTGKGMGRVKDNQFLFKPNVRFPMIGKYSFEIRQGMRNDNVKGVVNFGLSLYNTTSANVSSRK